MEYKREIITDQIKVLQALAIFTIILNHLNPKFLPSGFLGVDIFFFIFGYLIISYSKKFKNNNFTDYLISFFEYGIKIVFPSVIFFILITGILISFFHISNSASIKTGITALFGISNIAFYFKNLPNHNFANFSVLNPFMHTWSLGIIFQFYFVLPFILWLTGFPQKKKGSFNNLFFVFSALSTSSLILFIFFNFTNKSAAYFLMPSRFWEIGVGSLLYLWQNKKINLNQKLVDFSPSYLFLAILVVMFSPISVSFLTTIIVICLSSLLISSLTKERLFLKSSTFKILTKVGDLSFWLYLWHWSVISISIWTIGINWWTIPFQLFLIYFLAVLTKKYQKNLLKKFFIADKKNINIIISFSSLIISSFCLIQLVSLPTRTFMRRIGNKIVPAKYSTLDGFKNPLIKLYCHLPNNINDAFKDCFSHGNIDTSETNIYLTGDSHASNHYWSIQKAIKESNIKASLHVLSEYGIINGLIGEDNCGQAKICIKNAWKKYYKFFEENLTKDDIIIIGLSRDRTIKHSKNFPRLVDPRKIKSLESRLFQLANLSIKKRAKLILLDDIPKVCKFGTNFTLDILIKGSIEKCTILEEISIKDREGLTKVLSKISNQFKNVIYADPHSVLCYKGKCSILDENNKILYSDNNSHFREDNKEYLKSFWKEFFINSSLKFKN